MVYSGCLNKLITNNCKRLTVVVHMHCCMMQFTEWLDKLLCIAFIIFTFNFVTLL